MTQTQRYFTRFLVRIDRLRNRYVKHRNFLIVVSFIVGVLSALTAVLMKLSVQFVEHMADKLNNLMHSNWLTAIFPLVGVGISLLLLRGVYRGKVSRGVGFIVESIYVNKSRINRLNISGQMFTAAVTVAFGGSVGLEAPIVAAGAAIGSNAGTDLRVSHKDTTLLLACGVASGIAAIFNSPIAGIIFALEVLTIDFSIPFFIPLLISTATATVISQVLYPQKFIFLNISDWKVSALPFYILLGVLCGFVSVYTTTVVEKVEHYFNKKGLNWKTWLMASIPLCLIIFILPGLYGEGYSLITGLLHHNYSVVTEHSFLKSMRGHPWAVVVMCLLLIGFKSVTSSLTVSAGGNGGVFAPSLIIGGLLGFVYAFIVTESHIYPLNIDNFIIVAMAGVLAGVMHAPLTAIFLLAEITGGYKLFVPLMVVTAISYFITRKYVKHSIYHKSLVERHILTLNDEYDEENHF